MSDFEFELLVVEAWFRVAEVALSVPGSHEVFLAHVEVDRLAAQHLVKLIDRDCAFGGGVERSEPVADDVFVLDGVLADLLQQVEDFFVFLYFFESLFVWLSGVYLGRTFRVCALV